MRAARQSRSRRACLRHHEPHHHAAPPRTRYHRRAPLRAPPIGTLHSRPAPRHRPSHAHVCRPVRVACAARVAIVVAARPAHAMQRRVARHRAVARLPSPIHRRRSRHVHWCTPSHSYWRPHLQLCQWPWRAAQQLDWRAVLRWDWQPAAVARRHLRGVRQNAHVQRLEARVPCRPRQAAAGRAIRPC